MVITSDCLSDYGGSIPPRVAKIYPGSLLARTLPFQGEEEGSKPFRDTKIF